MFELIIIVIIMFIIPIIPSGILFINSVTKYIVINIFKTFDIIYINESSK